MKDSGSGLESCLSLFGAFRGALSAGLASSVSTTTCPSGETITRCSRSSRRMRMAERRWSEPEAYAELRRKAMDSNKRIAAI